VAPTIDSYRQGVLHNLEKYKQENPIDDLVKDEYVVIWTQWTTDLIRTCFYEKDAPIKIDEWVMQVANQIRKSGLQPILKLSPVENVKPFLEIHKEMPTYISRVKHEAKLPHARYRKNINAKLIAHAKYHVINCSSVSNELVLSGSPVIATGRSWFDNLGIFYEPTKWDDLLQVPSVSDGNRNKWINWWLSRQCPMDLLGFKLEEIYNKFTI
jgi:hypothetical protein